MGLGPEVLRWRGWCEGHDHLGGREGGWARARKYGHAEGEARRGQRLALENSLASSRANRAPSRDLAKLSCPSRREDVDLELPQGNAIDGGAGNPKLDEDSVSLLRECHVGERRRGLA